MSRPRKLPNPGATSGAPDHLLPDEDAARYDTLKSDILSELKPATAFQRRLAENIVNTEWDIDRHRRLLAATVRSAYFEAAEGAYLDGKPGRNASFGFSSEQTEFMSNLRSSSAAVRAQAYTKLASRGVTPSQLTAAAVIARESPVAYHEARISELERRRRQLLADYDLLVSASATKTQAPLIEDHSVAAP